MAGSARFRLWSEASRNAVEPSSGWFTRGTCISSRRRRIDWLSRRIPIATSEWDISSASRARVAGRLIACRAPKPVDGVTKTAPLARRHRGLGGWRPPFHRIRGRAKQCAALNQSERREPSRVRERKRRRSPFPRRCREPFSSFEPIPVQREGSSPAISSVWPPALPPGLSVRPRKCLGTVFPRKKEGATISPVA